MSDELMTPSVPADITSAVVASFAGCSDARLRELMQALARSLHAFASEVGLTHSEWEQAIRILTDTGHLTNEGRQEFVLWSDALGLSMLVDALEHAEFADAHAMGADTVAPDARTPDAPRRPTRWPTESTVLGPFYVPGSPLREYGASIAAEAAGVPAWVHGRVLDLDGEPIGGAELDVWQNGDDRLYAVQRPEGPEDHLRGRFRAREDGSYAFLAVRPVSYSIPDDGPVGRMLAATGRHPWRPAHIHMIVRARGYRTLTTHIFDSASEYLDSDAVFAVKPSLVREFVPRAAEDPERPAGVAGEWVSLESDIFLA